MLSRGRLYSLEVEAVFAWLQVPDVKRADNFLSVDHITCVDRPLRCAAYRTHGRSCFSLSIRIAGAGRKAGRRGT